MVNSIVNRSCIPAAVLPRVAAGRPSATVPATAELLTRLLPVFQQLYYMQQHFSPQYSHQLELKQEVLQCFRKRYYKQQNFSKPYLHPLATMTFGNQFCDQDSNYQLRVSSLCDPQRPAATHGGQVNDRAPKASA